MQKKQKDVSLVRAKKDLPVFRNPRRYYPQSNIDQTSLSRKALATASLLELTWSFS